MKLAGMLGIGKLILPCSGTVVEVVVTATGLVDTLLPQAESRNTQKHKNAIVMALVLPGALKPREMIFTIMARLHKKLKS